MAYFRLVYIVTHKTSKTGNGNYRRKKERRVRKTIHGVRGKKLKETHCLESVEVNPNCTRPYGTITGFPSCYLGTTMLHRTTHSMMPIQATDSVLQRYW
jgi:hypothetical protein